MNDIQKIDYWAEIAQKSGLFPNKTNIYQIKAILEIGRTIGLPPFQALKHISFIKGTINMEVAAQLALFKKAGGKVIKMESTIIRAYVKLEFQGVEYESEFTIQDAERMDLTNPHTREGKPYKGAYEKYPASMLLWRALGNKLKFIIPDLTMGLYGSDELASFLPDVEVEVEENLLADEEILKIIEKDIQVTEQLRFLNYGRRQVINLFKDFDGNLDRIAEVLANENRALNERNDLKFQQDNNIPDAILEPKKPEKKGKFDGDIDVSEAVNSYFNKKNKKDDELEMPFR
jgi:hypothetical protein